MLNKIRGALYGVAVGDALGAPLEFMTAEQIQQKHGLVIGMIGGGWLNVTPGEITDDTQMTLAVAEGIVEAPKNPVPAVGRRFIDWVQSGPKDIGGTCASAIRVAAAQVANGESPSMKQWLSAAQKVAKANGKRSGGNGALMRTVYPGLYYDEENQAVTNALSIASMTHWDDLSNTTCCLYTKIIYRLVRGMMQQDIVKILQNTDYENYAQQTMNPTGWVYDSMICALRCLMEASTFEAAVVRAANLGGDADTIAAITGGLAGALYGYDAIPRSWIDALAINHQLEELTKKAV